MTGPEHYRLAEAKLAAAREIASPASGHSDEDAIRLIGMALQRAQVHATLALAAAIVDGPAVMRPEDRDDWDRATGRTS